MKNVDSALVTATVKPDNKYAKCIGSVKAKKGCWSFLKGGFLWDSTFTSSEIDFQVFIYIKVMFFYLAIHFPSEKICVYFCRVQIGLKSLWR